MMWDSGVGTGFGALLAFGFMLFFGVLILVGITLLIIWLVRVMSHRDEQSGGGGIGSHSGTATACDIAKQRYARGEIDREQYEEICRTVGG